MGYIDSHSHIFFKDFDTKQALQHIDEEGFEKVLIVCTDLEQADKALKLATIDSRFDVAIGLHPSDVKEVSFEILEEIEKLCQQPNVVAIGEIGLDYYWDKDNALQQKIWFKKQIEIANRLNKPVIIHSRDAIEDTLNLLKENPCRKGGVLHCYSSSAEMAIEFIKLGYLISLAGPVTFKNARVPQEVAKIVPLTSLLTETDCPFLTPAPFRGQPNEPAYVKYNYQKIAELKELPIQDVIEQFSKNYHRVFKVGQK